MRFSKATKSPSHQTRPSRFTKESSPAFYRTGEWYELRRKTIERDGGKCTYCGEKATTADHIVPRGWHGADDLENLTACCMICNGIAGGNRFDSLDMKIEWVREKRATLIVKVKAARTPARKPWPKKKKIKKRRYPKGI